MHYLLMKERECVQIYVTQGVNPMPHWKEKGMGCVGSPNLIEFDEVAQVPDALAKIYDNIRDGFIKDEDLKTEMDKAGVSPDDVTGFKGNFKMGTEIIIKAQKIIQNALKEKGPLNVIDAIDMGPKTLAFARMSIDDSPFLTQIVDDRVVIVNTVNEGSTSVLDEIFNAMKEDEDEP